MELAESIKTAWTAVEESGIPDHMHTLAFKEALRTILGNHAEPPRYTPSTPRITSGEDEDGGSVQQHVSDPSEDEVLQRVSDETGVPIDKMDQVFHIDNGVVKLIGQHGKYGSNTSDQARNVARIVTVVRKLGMGHADTSFEVLKDACESKHCYDSKNFASQHMPKIDGFVVKGEGKSRRLEVKGAGISAFPDVIHKVLTLS